MRYQEFCGRTRNRWVAPLAVLLFVLLAGGGRALGAHQIIIEGTGDSQVILLKLAQLYEAGHPGTQVLIPDSVGSGGGIKALINGESDLARTARPLKEKERAHGLVQIPFAWSPIVFAAHASASSVQGITMDQALAVYQGKIVNWQALGGPDHKLYAVAREEGDSSRTVVDTYVTRTLGLPRGLGEAGKVFYTTGEAVLAISRNGFTLGYLPLSSAISAHLHVFSLEGVLPGETEVLTRRYPLVTTFYLVRPETPGGEVQAFLGFLGTEPAKAMMRSLGVFPADQPF